MIPPSLRLRIALTLLIPLGIFAIVTPLVVYSTATSAISREADARGEVLGRQIATVVVDELLTGERYVAERSMSDVIAAQDGIEYAFVADKSGKVVAHTFSGGFPTDLVEVSRIKRRKGEPVVVLLGDQKVHDTVAPVLAGQVGNVHVGVSTKMAPALMRVVYGRLFLVGLGVVLTGLLFTYGLSSSLRRRMARVADAAEAVGEGNLATRVDDNVGDEIGRIGLAFDRMAARLQVAKTDREQALLRLAQSEKLAAVGQLAAGVAHEINNPLTGVLHCLDALKKSDADAERRRDYYELMASGVVRGQRVVGKLLEYSRAHEIEVAPVALRAVVDDTLSLFGPAFEKAKVSVTFSAESGLPEVMADEHGMVQVLTNLFLNAADAMPKGGRLKIDLRQVGSECRLRVADTGCGIPAAEAGRVFDPFFTTKGGARGTGLGLAVSREIIERHGGRIDLTSESDHGATFDILLPVAETEQEAAQ